MKTILMSLIATLFSGTAFATPVQPSNCTMKFHVHIESLLLVSHGSGTGVVSCRDTNGVERARSTVDIAIKGIGLGLGVFDLNGGALNIGIMDPSQINGTYAVVDANAGFVAAAGASLGFVGQQNGLSFTGNLSLGHGAGAYVNGQTWTITTH